ncbi:MAG TPA: hypothetical protein DCQ14_05100 [Firmicutes bacterium]|nr:hypothetical protein [Bacillota bacterium]
MCLKDERGAALFVVLIVVMILMVLSTVFVFAMAAEGKQAAVHDHSVQAYYFARSGVDVARGWLQSRNFAIEPGTTYHLSGDLASGFAESQVAGAPIAVTISKFITAEGERIEIRATGRYLEEAELVILMMRRGLDLRPFSERGWVEGEDFFHSGNDELEEDPWTEGGNDNRISDTEGELWRSELPVQFLPGGGNNPVILQSKRAARFRAPEIHFERRLDIKNGAALNLSAVLVVFREDVDLKKDAVLCLRLYAGRDIGYVYFATGAIIDPGLYSFTGSVCLPAGVAGLKPLPVPEGDGWFEDLWQ